MRQARMVNWDYCHPLYTPNEVSAKHGIPKYSTLQHHPFPLTMAIFSPKKPLSLPLLAVLTIHLMLLHRVNSATSTTILDYSTGFRSDTDLCMQGNAVFTQGFALELTRERGGIPQGSSKGRTIEATPVLFKMNGNVASIYTNFVLNISQPNSTTPADGIAFSLINGISAIPPNSTGAFFGQFTNQSALSDPANEITFEFDTYPNLDIGDPDYRHIGINVGSIRSVATAKWDWENGEPLNVTITYDPSVKQIRVLASYPSGSLVDFTHDVDLASVFSGEIVYAAFSGSTGKYAQTNHVNTWFFNATVEYDEETVYEHNFLADSPKKRELLDKYVRHTAQKWISQSFEQVCQS